LCVYWIILFILTTVPSDALPSISGFDKLEHFTAYTVLTFMIGLAAHFQSIFNFKKNDLYLVVFSITATYSILDELHQIPIRGRYFDWLDLLANYVGIFVGLWIFRWFVAVKSSIEGFSDTGTND
jgi:VanZ family protein